jgi:hypothetical protein
VAMEDETEFAHARTGTASSHGDKQQSKRVSAGQAAGSEHLVGCSKAVR